MDNQVFFGEGGLTSTSANHIANMAKELIANLETTMNDLSFVNCAVSIIGSNEYTMVKRGNVSEELLAIPENLRLIAEAKSLIAWIREAIKAKQKLTDETMKMDEDGFVRDFYAERPIKPTMEHVITADEWISQLNVKDRYTIYDLQTKAAVIGKMVHQNGPLNEARKELTEKLRNDHKISGDGRDTLIYTYKPTVTTVAVEEVFFELQKKHREIQAELNGWLHKAEVVVQKDEVEKTERYNLAISKYNEDRQKLQEHLFEWKKNRIDEIGKLKIIIPKDLREIYTKVKNLGK